MRSSFLTLYKLIMIASLSTCEAPRPRQRPERPETEPAPLPELISPNMQVYLADFHDASNAACTRNMLDFTVNNLELCFRLRELIGDAGRVVYERFAYAPNVIVSWGARLCSDPELPNEQEYDECDAAFFCRVLTNFHPCPMSLLQEHLGQSRFRLKCQIEGQKAYLMGDQPDTIAGCFTEDEWRKHKETKLIEQERETLKTHPDSKVFEAEGKLLYAKPAAYFHPRFQCYDYASGQISKSEL